MREWAIVSYAWHAILTFMAESAPTTEIVRGRVMVRPVMGTLLRWVYARIGILIVVAGIVVLGTGVAAYKVGLVRNLQTVGHADSAAYALMGQSLARGHGLEVNYVSFFFVPYSRDITRREDHWPPFMGFAIAPFLWLYGEQAWAAKLAPILIGSIGLPLATALLGYFYSRRTYVGFVAGLLMMGHLGMFTASLTTLSDVASAMLVTAFLAAILATRRHPRAHVLAGMLAALAYYAKGSLIILVGLYPLLAVLAGGYVVITRRWMWFGMLTAALCLAPWMVSNYVRYGNALHSTQNYVSGYYGVWVRDDSWDEYTYRPYWGRGLPRTSDRWRDPQRYEQITRQNRTDMARFILLGTETNADAWNDLGPTAVKVRDWLEGETQQSGAGVGAGAMRPIGRWQEPVTEGCSVAAALLMCVLVVGTVPVMVIRRLWRRWWSISGEEASPVAGMLPEPLPLIFPTLAMLVVVASQWLFMSYLWLPMSRLAYGCLPVIAVMGCTAAALAVETPVRWMMAVLAEVLRWPGLRRWREWMDRWHWIVTAVVVVGVVGWAWRNEGELKAYHRSHVAMNGYPYSDQSFYPRAGAWIKEHLPHAVILCRNPWELLFGAAETNKAVGLPYTGDPGEVFAIARYYRATYYLHYPAARTMIGLDLSSPGLRRVQGTPAGVYLYELDYGRLPNTPATTQPD